MADEINIRIANYAQNKGLDAAEVAEQVDNIAQEINRGCDTIFDYGDDEKASFDELYSYLQIASGGSISEDEARMIFDILNIEGTDDREQYLSKEELSIITSKGIDKSQIQGYSFWNALLNADSAEAAAYSTALSSTDDSGEAEEESEATGSDAAGSDAESNLHNVGASPSGTVKVSISDLPQGYTIEDNKIMYGDVQIGEVTIEEKDTNGDGIEDEAMLYHLYANPESLPDNCYQTDDGKIYKFNKKGEKEKQLVNYTNNDEIQSLINNKEIKIDTETGTLKDKKGNVIGSCKYDKETESISDVYLNIDYYKHQFNNVPSDWAIDSVSGEISDKKGNPLKAIKPSDFGATYEGYTIKSGKTEVTTPEAGKTYDLYDGETLVGHLVVDDAGNKQYYVISESSVDETDDAATDDAEAAVEGQDEAEVVAEPDNAEAAADTEDDEATVEESEDAEATVEGIDDTDTVSAAEQTVEEAAATGEAEATVEGTEDVDAALEAEEVVERATISTEDAENVASELMTGLFSGNNAQIEGYLFSDELSDADLVKIFAAGGDAKWSTIISQADYLSSTEKKEYMQKFMEACINEAKAGNEDAIKILCQSLSNATDQMIGGTDYLTLDTFFDTADNETIELVKSNYGQYNDGHELYEDINNEWMLFHDGKKAKYKQKINLSGQ
ncbi:hypothetical protein IJ182_08985 [bacterium]|nr:hypothetical protein [bacterium]